MARDIIHDVVGLTEEEAVKVLTGVGLTCRVRERNGEKYLGTCDVRPNRVNLVIVDDKVTSAIRG